MTVLTLRRPPQGDGSMRCAARLLRGLLRRTAVRGDEIVHCRLHAAFLVRHVRESQGHFGCRQSTQQHCVVDVTEMADAEHLAGEAAEAGAVCDIEWVQCEMPGRRG